MVYINHWKQGTLSCDLNTFNSAVIAHLECMFLVLEIDLIFVIYGNQLCWISKMQSNIMHENSGFKVRNWSISHNKKLITCFQNHCHYLSVINRATSSSQMDFAIYANFHLFRLQSVVRNSASTSVPMGFVRFAVVRPHESRRLAVHDSSSTRRVW